LKNNHIRRRVWPHPASDVCYRLEPNVKVAEAESECCSTAASDSAGASAAVVGYDRDKALNEILRQVDDHVVLVLSAAFIDCDGQPLIFHWFPIRVESDELLPKIFMIREATSFPPFLAVSP
jgi:hypothetical protein